MRWKKGSLHTRKSGTVQCHNLTRVCSPERSRVGVSETSEQGKINHRGEVGSSGVKLPNPEEDEKDCHAGQKEVGLNEAIMQ